MKKRFLFGVLIALFAAGLPLKGVCQTKDHYRVGAVLSITGFAGAFGTGQKEAIGALVDTVNKRGGINGTKVELFIEDDQSQPTNANIAVSKLINDNKVHAVLGSTLTNSCMAIIPTIERAEIPNISYGAGYEIARPTKKWVFQNGPTDEGLAPEMIKFGAKVLKGKKAAIIYSTDASGQMGGRKLKEIAPQYGLQVVDVEEFGPADTNMIPQLTKVNRAKPDVLFAYTTSQGAGILAKNIKQLGMKMPIIGSHGIPMPRFLQVAGDAAEGWILFTQKATIGTKISSADPWRKRFDEFIKITRAKYPNSVCDTFAANAYDSMGILLEAFIKAGTKNEALRSALENATHSGVNGDYRYTSQDHAGFDASKEIPVIVKAGEFEMYK
ncbi:MAG: ABC transporter substrate-binding protein [Desulfobacterales bacterium]|nr:ABC transporter substrate-binding protein [Desulfobacterales bacterium]